MERGCAGDFAKPADFAAARVADSKIKKASGPPAIALTPTVDILADTRALRRAGCVVVGFALETGDAVANGHAKLVAKGLDAIVVNDAREPGAGFEVDTNRVTVLFADGRVDELPLMPKTEVADELMDRVERMIDGR